MRDPVRPDIMPGRYDLPYKLAILLGNRAKDEKSCLNIVLLQKSRQFLGSDVQSPLRRIPDGGRHWDTLVPIFEIDCESVAHGPPLWLGHRQGGRCH